MAPSAYDAASQYTTADDIKALLSDDGVNLRLDDDNSGAINAAELTRLTTYAINYATSKINDHAIPRYDAADLATSWTICEWATIIAARWLCARRMNPIPESLQALYDEVREELKALRDGSYTLGDISERVSSAPAWSNVRVSVHYRLRRIRVQRPISEQTPRRIAPNADRAADIMGPEW